MFCRNDEDETECVISKGTVTSIHKMVRSVVSINGTKYKVKCNAVVVRGVTRGQWERNYPGAESLWGRGKILTMSQVHSSTADLLPKDLRFEHGALNLLLALGAI